MDRTKSRNRPIYIQFTDFFKNKSAKTILGERFSTDIALVSSWKKMYFDSHFMPYTKLIQDWS